MCAIFAIALSPDEVLAGANFTVSPMTQEITLTPGETFYGTFKVTNPSTSEEEFNYVVQVDPFTVDDSNTPVYEYREDYNQIVDWITLDDTSGVIPPDTTKEIRFRIDVPENAPAGGQYASISIGVKNESPKMREEEQGQALGIQTGYQIAHLVYAEIAGETIKKGFIEDINVPSFLFSGKINGNVKIRNEGNVHSRATAVMQIFPLFSGEEIYTNEENPQTIFSMPGVSRMAATEWDDTPTVGIFHVIYTVEFGDIKSSVDKYVIICPIWLLFLIILGIILIIFRILSAKKKN